MNELGSPGGSHGWPGLRDMAGKMLPQSRQEEQGKRGGTALRLGEGTSALSLVSVWVDGGAPHGRGKVERGLCVGEWI